jgi:hypothetical protein
VRSRGVVHCFIHAQFAKNLFLLIRCKLAIPASGTDFLQRFLLNFINGKTRVTHEVLIVAVRTQIGSSIQVIDGANLVCDHFT